MTAKGELSKTQREALIEAYMLSYFPMPHANTMRSLEARGLAERDGARRWWKLTPKGYDVAKTAYHNKRERARRA